MIMELFDSHFHFFGEQTPGEYLENIRMVLLSPQQTKVAAVDKVYLLAMGGDHLESIRAREFAQTAGDLAEFAVGVHPHNAEAYLESREDFSCFFTSDGKQPAAIGELGLDYFYDHSPKEKQQQVLQQFLDMALEKSLPAVIHIRDKEDVFDAYSDAYALLKPFAAKGGRFTVHCFAGNPEWAEKFLDLGAYCGVTGMVTFKKAENIRAIVPLIPDDKLLIETDAPYLAPVPHRGTENQPGYLIHTANYLAVLKGMPLEELAELTTANARRFLA